MIKQIATTVSLLFSFSSLYAQDCEAVKAENKRLKYELAMLKSDVLMKKADAMLTQTQSANDIDFTVLSATGDKKTQLVTVVLKFTNRAANKEGFITPIENFSNSEGEEFKLKGGFGGYRTLATDASLQGTYVFGGVLPKITTIKMFRVPFEFTEANYKRHQVEFRGVAINWK